MNTETNGIQDSMKNLVEDTKTLMAATAEVAEERVIQARNRLASTLESAKGTYVRAQKRAVETAKVADQAVRDHPYHAIGLALGVGALIGYLFHRRN